MISPISANNPAPIPHVQKRTLRNPSWTVAKTMMPSKNSQPTYLTGRHSPQLYTGLLVSERFADSAMDVTMIAAPMAFCLGVRDAQPEVSASKQMSSVFMWHMIAQVANAN